MFEGQLDFYETLVVPPRSGGRGRPQTLAGSISKQKAAAAKARKAAKAALTEAAFAEDYRQKRKKWDAKRYKAHPEKVKAGARRSYRKHFETKATTSAERYRRFARQGMLYRAEKRATEKGWAFDLTIEDIIIPALCPVLGIPLHIGSGGAGKGWSGTSEHSPTLDRIDNSRGYVKGNVCVISWRANRKKGDASIAEMEQLLSYMRAHHG